jgi:hypothetical protein
MDLTTIDPIWWIVLGAVVVVVLIGLLVWSGRTRTKRTRRLKDQFKSEYDRTAESRSRKEAEEDLERRLTRRAEADLEEVTDSEAETLEDHIDDLVRSFVEGPQGAARGMVQLIGRVATARGYVAAEEGSLDLVSVDHPEQVAALRRAMSEMEQAKGSDLTETSRQVFLDARTLAERLLAEGRASHLPDDARDPTSAEPPPEPQVEDAMSTAPPAMSTVETPEAGEQPPPPSQPSSTSTVETPEAGEQPPPPSPPPPAADDVDRDERPGFDEER